MNGILIIDKPQGITSHDVVRRVRRLLGTRRVGHAGTLDPLATGILQVAVGEGTRLVQFLMEGNKTYRATLKLGEITDTQDTEGTIRERRPIPALTKAQIEAACVPFTGRIRQCPPMYSALKRNGVSLHRLAREGIEVERELREIVVHRLVVLAVDLPYVTVEVECSKGTYVRTLCHDLGEDLGPGAHLVRLRRTRSGAFAESESTPLEELETAGACRVPLLTLPQALRGYPVRELTAAAAGRLRDGVPPAIADVAGPAVSPGDMVQLLFAGHLRAIGRFAPDRVRERRGDFELLRVFHPPGDG